MSKRKALEPLEDVVDAPSPASKRAHVDGTSDTAEPSNGATSNGRLMLPRPANRDKIDILGADAEERMELQEAGAVDAEDDDDNTFHAPTRPTAPEPEFADLYLDTINRKVLDFDFEKLCSVTLSHINVYACLVCGKYFQGRGPKSQAYFHALEVNHHPFINMETKKVYVLPDNYEVTASSLEDIKYQVNPYLSKEQVAKLDKEKKVAWDLDNKEYIPGFVGMNNIKANDYFNVVIQALARVIPLRNYFILEDLSKRNQLAQRFGTLMRKIWNPKAFKSHVSPHELIQEIALRSSKRFTLTEQSDPVDFLLWFLNHLHLSVGGSKTKPRSSIVQKVFQGTLKIESQEITARADLGDRLRFEDAAVKTQVSNFMVLTLDLPAQPLFQDMLEKNIIPQVQLKEILKKYNGVQAQEKSRDRVRYRLLHPLPPYLLFHIKRFSKNKFVFEHNGTIVTFSASEPLDMAPYVEPNAEHPGGEPILYDLVANITHEAVKKSDDSVSGEQDLKLWRVQVPDRSREDHWWGIQDLFVEAERSETLFTKESYLMIWERRKS